MDTKQTTSNLLRVESSNHVLSIFRDNQSVPIITQNAQKDKRPYKHPILAPDGNGILTEDAPAHHPWQHGLYTGLNDINGVGFWEEGVGNGYDGSFHPKVLGTPIIEDIKVHWTVETDWRSPDGTHMITEGQQWTITDYGKSYNLDLVWTLRAEIDLTFGQHEYGGIFLRMPYKSKLGGIALNSEGKQNSDAEAQRAKWVTASMPIEGRDDWAGIAIMDHTENTEHPVPWRVDDQLGIAPSRCIEGTWKLSVGQVECFNHRLFIYCGAADEKEIEENWRLFNGGI